MFPPELANRNIQFIKKHECMTNHWRIIKPAVAVRKTASADLGNPNEDAKKYPFLRIEPLIVAELFTKIGQKLFTH